ncbi:hypothetical protein EQM14_01155 [Caproiciproducens sp. NJN-50]|uniref:hypothetical protein n=1 Tax=Acutalibacteraceae TaxID=3082771 RepID=UPI000FFE00D1|nr:MULTISPECIES: hypothetical protein [Acutalibacteraceae]QAT48494.1 hypothetical protein EQM14_01155 [Caproiciproducens sp. NJN-50]
MLRTWKKSISLLLVFALSITACAPAFAAEKNRISIDNIKIPNPSTRFIDFFTDYFKNHSSFSVLDRTGNDINESFYKNNLNYYHSSDFKAIEIFVCDKVSSVCKHTEIKKFDSSASPNSSFVKKTISDIFYHPLTADIGDRFVEVWDTITGTYVYNANTGKISEYSSPKLHVDFQNTGYGVCIPRIRLLELIYLQINTQLPLQVVSMSKELHTG